MENSFHCSKTSSKELEVNDDGIMKMYFQSLIQTLKHGKIIFIYIEIQSHIGNNKNISFSFLEFKKQKCLLIKLKFHKLTELNKHLVDILFHIEIVDQFPEIAPILTCHTNVI